MDELLRHLLGEKAVPVPELGAQLRLLSAKETLEAACRLEDMEARGVSHAAMHFLAHILSRALYKDGARMYMSGDALLDAVTTECLTRLTGLYARLLDDVSGEERLEQLKESLRRSPGERMKWRVLKELGALPTEARDMTDSDYLYCGLNLLLDREEAAQKLCPTCREAAEGGTCPGCGGRTAAAMNPGFDEKRFEELKNGSLV